MATDKPGTTRTLSRRKTLAALGGAGAMALAGCQDFLSDAAERDETLRTVAVESGQDGDFYYPTQENIESGVYSPLTRPLFIYVNHATLEEDPDLIGSFVEHYFEGQHDYARQTGYYAATDEVRDGNLDSIRDIYDDIGIDEPDPSAAEGEIDCSGSNTVAPVTRAAGESFENEHDDVLVAVNPEGTGAGFQDFVRGDSDIQSASRTILDDEAELAEENGVEYSHYEIGWDGLAVVAHTDNDWLTEITLDELHDIWRFESDITQWSDVRDEWPDEDIGLWGRDDASGTFDYYTREINGEIGSIRTDYSPHTDTGSIMEGVADDEYALGWGGVGYYTELRSEPFDYIGEYR